VKNKAARLVVKNIIMGENMTREQIKDFTLKISQANHSGLILILTDICEIYIDDAVSCFDNSDAAGFKQKLELSLKGVNELISCFNPANEQSREVIALLRYIYGRLSTSQAKRRPVDMEQCKTILEGLKPGFERLHELDDEGPVMHNTHQVYAGLTYGRGTLNEDVQSMSGEHRGFFA
jgi:flagellar protein FliS